VKRRLLYTEVVGLGQNPSQTVITGGGIYANAAWNNGNATENFWRGVENTPATRHPAAPSGRSPRPTRCAG